MREMAPRKKVYRALVGFNWVDEEGNEHRINASDKVEDIPENVIQSEKAAGNLEPWKERDTSNVKPDNGILHSVSYKGKGHNMELVGEVITEERSEE
jgi:hypothetical protein